MKLFSSKETEPRDRRPVKPMVSDINTKRFFKGSVTPDLHPITRLVYQVKRWVESMEPKGRRIVFSVLIFGREEGKLYQKVEGYDNLYNEDVKCKRIYTFVFPLYRLYFSGVIKGPNSG